MQKSRREDLCCYAVFLSKTVQTRKKEMSLWITKQCPEVGKQEISVSNFPETVSPLFPKPQLFSKFPVSFRRISYKKKGGVLRGYQRNLYKSNGCRYRYD